MCIRDSVHILAQIGHGLARLLAGPELAAVVQVAGDLDAVRLGRLAGLAADIDNIRDVYKRQVLGERALLGRAVENLLSNAAHYSPAGAEVRVSTRLRAGRPVLTVENTRAHLSEGDIPHLFEAFYRAEQSRNRRTGGSGLGLYLVRMILQRCHAVCTACNTPEGVSFTITLSLIHI